MNHYTLNTGHSRQSPRSEVADHVIEICRPLLMPGEYVMPNDPHYTLAVPRMCHGWAGTVRRGTDRPIVTFGCADTIEAAAEIWPELEALYLRLTDKRPFAGADFAAPSQPALPWCAAMTILPDPAMDWLGDFERCMAWAWFERERAI